MIDLAVLKGSSFVVLGLARSGLATVRALRAAGIECVAWDDNAASRDAAAHLGARIADPVTIDWSGVSALVISPGIPSTLPVPHPVAVAARAAGKPGKPMAWWIALTTARAVTSAARAPISVRLPGWPLAPVAKANSVSPSLGVWIGSMLRARPSCAMPATLRH